jgi:hypothetical protein
VIPRCVIGVDPGAKFSGLAVDLDGQFVFWLESDDPVVLWEVIEINAAEHKELVVVLEDILGEGPRGSSIQRTIEILGYIYHRCREAGIPCERVPNQVRLANVKRVPNYIRRKDERAAAAHVLSYRERQAIGSKTQHHRSSHRRGRPPAIPDAG